MLSLSSAFAGREIGNGGDPVRIIFTKGKARAADMLRWVSADDLVRSSDPRLREEILNIKEAWSTDLDASDLVFTEEERGVCVYAGTAAEGTIEASFPTCQQRRWRVTEAAQELMGLVGGRYVTEATASRAAEAVVNAWKVRHEQMAWKPTTIPRVIGPRFGHLAVWTGHAENPDVRNKMIVLGGLGSESSLSDGAMFDPKTNTWSSLLIPNELDAPRMWGGAAIWTGQAAEDGAGATASDRLLLWGGEKGLVWNSQPNVWQQMAEPPVSLKSGFSANWIDGGMYVFGSPEVYAQTPQGAVYDPVQDTWRVIDSATPELFRRTKHSAVWSGDELIVWGGGQYYDYRNDGFLFRPRTNEIIPMSQVHAPSPRTHHIAVWTGYRMLIYGGQSPEGKPLKDGAAYDPATDTWTPLPDMPMELTKAVGLVLDDHLWVWGGQSRFAVNDKSLIFDFITEEWVERHQPAPQGRTEFSAVYTGESVIIWGGGEYGGRPGTRIFDEGGIYAW